MITQAKPMPTWREAILNAAIWLSLKRACGDPGRMELLMMLRDLRVTK